VNELARRRTDRLGLRRPGAGAGGCGVPGSLAPDRPVHGDGGRWQLGSAVRRRSGIPTW